MLRVGEQIEDPQGISVTLRDNHAEHLVAVDDREDARGPGPTVRVAPVPQLRRTFPRDVVLAADARPQRISALVEPIEVHNRARERRRLQLAIAQRRRPCAKRLRNPAPPVRQQKLSRPRRVQPDVERPTFTSAASLASRSRARSTFRSTTYASCSTASRQASATLAERWRSANVARIEALEAQATDVARMLGLLHLLSEDCDCADLAQCATEWRERESADSERDPVGIIRR